MRNRTRDLIMSESLSYGKCPDHALISPDGDVTRTSFTLHRRTAEAIVKANKVWAEEFKSSNKNRGYDELEFLIIVKGYVSINSSNANWHSDLTYKQREVFRNWGQESPDNKKARMEAFFSDMC